MTYNLEQAGERPISSSSAGPSSGGTMPRRQTTTQSQDSARNPHLQTYNHPLDDEPAWEAPKTRPAVVTAIVVLTMIGTIITLFRWLPLLPLMGDVQALPSYYGDLRLQYYLNLYVAPVVITLNIVMAIGLWKLRGWGRTGAITIFALQIAASLLTIPAGAAAWVAYLQIALSALFIVLLALPSTTRAFDDTPGHRSRRDSDPWPLRGWE